MYVNNTCHNRAKNALSVYFYSKNSRFGTDKCTILALHCKMTTKESTRAPTAPNYLILLSKYSAKLPKITQSDDTPL